MPVRCIGNSRHGQLRKCRVQYLIRGMRFAHAQVWVNGIVDELHETVRVLKYRVRIIRLVCMPVRKWSKADFEITRLIRQKRRGRIISKQRQDQ